MQTFSLVKCIKAFDGSFYLFVELKRLVVTLYYIPQKIELREIGRVSYIYLAHHTEVFNRKCDYLAFFQLVKANTLYKYRHAEISPYKVFYSCDIVHLKNDIEVVYAHVVALKVSNKKVSCS